MRKAGSILLLLLIFPILLFAQEEDPLEPDWDYYQQEQYTRGDQTFIISLGAVFPMFFLNNGRPINHKIDPPIGGTGSMAYNYYLSSKYYVGLEVAGMFLPTYAGNTLYIIPIGLRGGYQLNTKRFEFPLTLVFGMVWHRYLDDSYFGIYIKGGGAGYIRATANWSFGVNLDWLWLPQWTSDNSKNVDGNILNLTLSARYHF